MDLRTVQRPLRERYRRDAGAALITLRATSSAGDNPVACSVDIGRAIYEAQAHAGVGGPGTAACSGDLLLGALAACAQVTCQMVATAMEIEVRDVKVEVEGELDLRGTLGLAPDVPVGFERISTTFSIDAPSATPEQLESLRDKTERYCVVFQTLTRPPRLETRWS